MITPAAQIQILQDLATHGFFCKCPGVKVSEVLDGELTDDTRIENHIPNCGVKEKFIELFQG